MYHSYVYGSVTGSKNSVPSKSKKSKNSNPEPVINSFTEHNVILASVEHGLPPKMYETISGEGNNNNVGSLLSDQQIESFTANVDPFDSSDLFNLANELIGADGISDAMELHRQD